MTLQIAVCMSVVVEISLLILAGGTPIGAQERNVEKVAPVRLLTSRLVQILAGAEPQRMTSQW